LRDLVEVPDEPQPLLISVRLPPSESLSDFGEVVGDIIKIFDRPASRLAKTPDALLFSGVDHGSNWVLFTAVNVFILKVVGWIVRFSLDIIHLQNQREQSLKTLSSADEQMQKHLDALLEDAQKKSWEKLSAAWDEMLKTENPDLTNEDRRENVNLLMSSAERLAGLTRRGMRVRLELAAPEAVRAQIPDFAKVDQICIGTASPQHLLGAATVAASDGGEAAGGG